ncbi:hypothetical protein [Herbaspirillum sp. ST 5-3]|uniref:hypothetical protein n=1 Tax=Oxalobacteraceae TaxID=75682 RepID=UPI00145618DC|nr:hypothetical protein [Herbaspirillum sp. ST 5-3]
MSALVKIADLGGRNAAEICDTPKSFESGVRVLRMRATVSAIEQAGAAVTAARGHVPP